MASFAVLRKPRAQHAIHTVPPPQSGAYAAAHDDAVWRTLQHFLSEPDETRSLAFLPTKSGGLGLCCAERVRMAACWAAWADALPGMRQPGGNAGRMLQHDVRGSWQPLMRQWRLHCGPPKRPGIGFVAGRDRQLACPNWRMAPRHPSRRWQHTRAPASTLAPPPSLGSCSVWWRWRTGCGARVDALGDHRAACARSGLLARRAPILERAWVRVAREAVGAESRVVPQHWLVHTTAPGIPADDRRRLDFVLYGATRRGEALCCDVTLVSPLRADGRVQPGSRDGAAIEVARRRKLARYPEVVLASEVVGRWGGEAHDSAALFACGRCELPALRAAATAGWRRRWWGFLGCAQQSALASTLLGGTWRTHARVGAAR
eukprot:s9450_g2.t1